MVNAAENSKPESELQDERIREISEKIAKDGTLSGRERQTPTAAGGVWGIEREEKASGKTPPPVPPAVAEKPVESAVLKNLRTYQGDVAEAVGKTGASVLTITLAERKREEEEKKTASPVRAETKKNILLVLVSVALVTLGSGVIAGLIILSKRAPALPEASSPPQSEILPYQEKISYNTNRASRESLIEMLSANQAKWSGKDGDILFFDLTKTVSDVEQSLDTKTFFEILDTQIPPALMRALDSKFMLGFLGTQNATETFLLIRVDSFGHAFAGMLEWERDLWGDLGAILSPKTLVVTAPTPTAATSSPTTTAFLTFESEVSDVFEDLTVRNKDARVLRNGRGDIIFLYAFLDQKTLLITANRAIFETLASKVASFSPRQ